MNNNNYFLIGVIGDYALQMYSEKYVDMGVTNMVDLGVTRTEGDMLGDMVATSTTEKDKEPIEQSEQKITEPVQNGFTGLVPYFKQHGKAESLTIAGGLMYGAKELYDVLPVPKNDFTLAIYSAGLDYAFRKGKFFKSLDKYYENTSIQESMLYAVIPMLMGKYIKLV